jgi:two-component system, sensor histidine kinase PdtaS
MNGRVSLSIYFLLIIFLSSGYTAFAQGRERFTTLEASISKSTFDTSLISQLLQLGEYYTDKNNASARDGDSALRMAAHIVTISKKQNYQRGIGLSLLLQSKALRLTGQRDAGRKAGEEAVKMLRVSGKPEEYVSAIVDLGRTYSNESTDLPEKIRLYEEAATLYHQQRNVLDEARTLEFVADLNYLKQDYKKSLELLHQALRLYQSIHYPKLQGVYGLMGVVYNISEQFLTALHYNQLAVTTAEQQGDTSSLMTTIYNRLAINYFDVRAFDQAMIYYQKGLQSARRLHDSAAMGNLLIHISQCEQYSGNYKRGLDTLRVVSGLLHTMDLADHISYNMQAMKYSLLTNDNAGASTYYKNLLTIYQQHQASEKQLQVVRLGLVQYLQATNQFSTSNIYLEEFRKALPKYPVNVGRIYQYEQYASRVDSAAGNMAGALVHYQRYKQISDSLTNITTTRQIGQLQVAFETEKKDKNIALLQQKNTFQQHTLQRERAIRYVIIGALALLLAFCVMLYKAYHLKKANNQILESQQTELKKLLGEKEWLLKEIHHRVKNNLQIVISLLNSQSAYLDNEAAISAISNSQHRMHAMSLIHQKLYQTDGVNTINMQWYCRELTNYMEDCFSTQHKINFKLDVTPAEFDVAQAVPVGLILNEAVTNAIKYAFPDGRKGKITIELKPEDDEYVLTIADNGIGLPEDFDIDTTDSLGMNLINGLSQQLGGILTCENCDGLKYSIRFNAESQLHNRVEIPA